MAISLKKGGNVSLSGSAPNLTRILVGLGWEARQTSGADFDLDACAFLLGSGGKVRNDEDFIFYNAEWRTEDESTAFRDPAGRRGMPTHETLCVVHTGDNRTGAGDGDDESLKIFLNKVPEGVLRIAITVTIHDADDRKQNFGMVQDAFIRVVNLDNDVEIARFDLSEDFSSETAMIFGEVYRHGGEWKFKAVGQGYSGGLEAMCKSFGVNVA